MDELLSLIFSALGGVLKRGAARREAATTFMREALAARVAASSPAAPVAGTPSPRRRPTSEPAPTTPAVVTASPGLGQGSMPNLARPVPERPSRAEAALVRGIFSNPRSLAAAFIAAEILAPPLALRER